MIHLTVRFAAWTGPDGEDIMSMMFIIKPCALNQKFHGLFAVPFLSELNSITSPYHASLVVPQVIC